MHQLLDSVWKGLAAEDKNKASKECLIAALDKMADAASLPYYGAVKEVSSHLQMTKLMIYDQSGRSFFSCF